MVKKFQNILQGLYGKTLLIISRMRNEDEEIQATISTCLVQFLAQNGQTRIFIDMRFSQDDTESSPKQPNEIFF